MKPDFLAALASLTLLCGCATDRLDGIPAFQGGITKSKVKAFIDEFSDKPPALVILNSTGGDVEAAMTLGNWIHDHRIDVEIRGICASSCANYLFTAGAHKTIVAPAVVFWHGSMLQKDIRERQEKILRALAPGNSDLRESAARSSDGTTRKYYNTVDRLTRLQAAFFKKVQVGEYITRAGQEPRRLNANWTIRRDDMAQFGVCDVTAPEDYGSDAYLQEWSDSSVKRPPVKLLAIDAEIREELKTDMAKQDYRIRSCN